MNEVKDRIHRLLGDIKKYSVGSSQEQTITIAVEELETLVGVLTEPYEVVGESLYCLMCSSEPKKSIVATTMSDGVKGCEASGHAIRRTKTILDQ